jgi:hypothetical protein
MKLRALLAIALFAAVPQAGAETLARTVESRARDLLPAVEAQQAAAARRAALPAVALDKTTVAGLETFALDVSRLSREADAAGATDLRCIFRGMAEETAVQLDAAGKARTGTEQTAALNRLAHMLKDAVEIAPAAEGGKPGKPPGKCKT